MRTSSSPAPNAAHCLTPLDNKQVSIALAVASTSVVPSSVRGKLSGLYGTAESFGRFTGAVGFAILFAWSVSPHSSVRVGWPPFRVPYVRAGVGCGDDSGMANPEPRHVRRAARSHESQANGPRRSRSSDRCGGQRSQRPLLEPRKRKELAGVLLRHTRGPYDEISHFLYVAQHMPRSTVSRSKDRHCWACPYPSSPELSPDRTGSQEISS